jgi:hypothetical protein
MDHTVCTTPWGPEGLGHRNGSTNHFGSRGRTVGLGVTKTSLRIVPDDRPWTEYEESEESEESEEREESRPAVGTRY